MSEGPEARGHTRTVVQDGVAVALKLKRYKLTIVEGPDAPFSGSFIQRTLKIGSSPENDIVLQDPTASRFHCQIEVDGLGYRVTDLDSKNGTFLGSIRIKEGYLGPETRLRIGETSFRWAPESEEVEVQFSTQARFGELIGESLSMREIFASLERVAASDATLLVEGESGTGKELVAQAIHNRSPRAAGPFLVFDCSAVPRELIESELFGHERGAFTGATQKRDGAFKAADGGTLFIDELGELSADLQPKLLRVLESGTVKPIGSNTPVKTDVRIVAATNRRLEAEVSAGHFRQDLYYRLAVVLIRLPPLRERPQDIPALVRHFLRVVGKDPDRFKVSYDTMKQLQRHPWPGNVRELKNFVERAALLSDGSSLSESFLDAAPPDNFASKGQEDLSFDPELPFKDAKARLVQRFEQSYWEQMLAASEGNVSEAARRAGIHRKSAEYLLKKLGIKR